MDMEELSKAEIEKLRKLLPLAPHVPDIVEDAEIRKSWRIVRKHYKAAFTATAAVLAFLFLIWDRFRDTMVWLFR